MSQNSFFFNSTLPSTSSSLTIWSLSALPHSFSSLPFPFSSSFDPSWWSSSSICLFPVFFFLLASVLNWWKMNGCVSRSVPMSRNASKREHKAYEKKKQEEGLNMKRELRYEDNDHVVVLSFCWCHHDDAEGPAQTVREEKARRADYEKRIEVWIDGRRWVRDQNMKNESAREKRKEDKDRLNFQRRRPAWESMLLLSLTYHPSLSSPPWLCACSPSLRMASWCDWYESTRSIQFLFASFCPSPPPSLLFHFSSSLTPRIPFPFSLFLSDNPCLASFSGMASRCDLMRRHSRSTGTLCALLHLHSSLLYLSRLPAVWLHCVIDAKARDQYRYSFCLLALCIPLLHLYSLSPLYTSLYPCIISFQEWLHGVIDAKARDQYRRFFDVLDIGKLVDGVVWVHCGHSDCCFLSLSLPSFSSLMRKHVISIEGSSLRLILVSWSSVFCHCIVVRVIPAWSLFLFLLFPLWCESPSSVQKVVRCAWYHEYILVWLSFRHCGVDVDRLSALLLFSLYLFLFLLWCESMWSV